MKRSYMILFLLFILAGIQAQEYVTKSNHYLYLNAGGGLHPLSYKLDEGNTKESIGYSFNLGYCYLFTQKYGLQVGFGLNSYQTLGTLTYISKGSATDSDGDTYELRTYYNGWIEKQHALCLNIPIGFQYKCKFQEKLSLLITAGGEVSVPVKSTYEVTSGNIETRGYYSKWDVELADMPQHGFTTITTRYEDDISLKPAYSIFADFGGLYGLNQNVDLFVGGYVSYGLNNIIDAGNKEVFQNGNYNGVFSSSQTDKVTLIAMGLKVGVFWKFRH